MSFAFCSLWVLEIFCSVLLYIWLRRMHRYCCKMIYMRVSVWSHRNNATKYLAACYKVGPFAALWWCTVKPNAVLLHITAMRQQCRSTAQCPNDCFAPSVNFRFLAIILSDKNLSFLFHLMFLCDYMAMISDHRSSLYEPRAPVSHFSQIFLGANTMLMLCKYVITQNLGY